MLAPVLSANPFNKQPATRNALRSSSQRRRIALHLGETGVPTTLQLLAKIKMDPSIRWDD